MKLSVVIPAQDEEDVIGATVEGVVQVLARERIDHEILVVDDASSDGTRSVVEAVAAQHPTEAKGAAEFSAVTDLTFPASDYFETADRLGSPAYDEAELAGALDGARGAADEVFVRNLGIAIQPRPESAPPRTSEAPTVDVELNTTTEPRGSCLITTPASAGSGFISVELPAGGFAFSSDVAPPVVGLRRFAETEIAELSGAGTSGAVAIPTDASSRPWRAAFEVTAETRICPL